MYKSVKRVRNRLSKTVVMLLFNRKLGSGYLKFCYKMSCLLTTHYPCCENWFYLFGGGMSVPHVWCVSRGQRNKINLFFIQTCWGVKLCKFAFVCSNVLRNVSCCLCHGPHNLRVSQLRQQKESRVVVFTRCRHGGVEVQLTENRSVTRIH